jgi:hypothetical protein
VDDQEVDVAIMYERPDCASHDRGLRGEDGLGRFTE